MPDAIFADPRLAAVYDALEGSRDDLDAYVAIVDELGARRVVDVGCGTGCLAVLLAGRGVEVVGVDPARASLDVARAKPGAASVRWIEGDATALPPVGADAAFMTGNVAQVFLTDEAWAVTLGAVGGALRPGGTLVFETREPSQRAWERWTREETAEVVDVPGVGAVESWTDLVDVRPGFVTFRSTTVFRDRDDAVESTSTLRFRTRDEVTDSLAATGYDVVDVRDAPDRPGLELVFLARWTGAGQGP